MPVLLLLLAAMAIEIVVIVLVGHLIGVVPTILLLVVASMLGVALLRREGARTREAIVQAMRDRRVPQREMTDGVVIAIAGVLIVVPGFVSDVVALILLFPPTRAMILRRVRRRAEQRATARGERVVVVDADFEVHEDRPRRDQHGQSGNGKPPFLLPGEGRGPNMA